MPQGIIQVSPIGLIDLIDLTIDPALIDLGKLKDVLLLPERYTVEQVRRSEFSTLNVSIEVIVSSPDIPEVPDEEALPIVTPIYTSENSEDFKTRAISLDDIMISAVSAIREEDKERKRIIEIKEVKDVSAGSARDSHFRGFAKLLFDDLQAIEVEGLKNSWNNIDIYRRQRELIARKAYDLAKSTVDNAREYCLEGCCTENIMTYIPDLTELPKDNP